MKSVSKSNGSRAQRAARTGVAMSRKTTHDFLDDVELEALDEDLERLDLDRIDEGGDDDSMTDWVSDRDFALQIARGALH